MAIIRKKAGRYLVMPQKVFEDEHLSFKGIGMLAFLLSLPDNWEFSENGLIAVSKNDGQVSIRTALKELENGGYLIRKRVRDEAGRVSGVEWNIYDEPHLENPHMEVRPQSNTNKSNTNRETIITPLTGSNNIKEKTTEPKNKRFVPPTIEEVRAYCSENNIRIDAEQFWYYYDSKNWVCGKTKMSRWKSAVRLWERNERKYQNSSAQNKPTRREEEPNWL